MKRIYHEWKTLYQQFDRLLLLFVLIFATVEVVWVPLNSWLSEFLLDLTGYAYLSPTNLLSVLSAKWWVTLLFVSQMLANLILVYLEIGLLVVGLNRILKKEEGLKAYLSYLLMEVRRIFRQLTVAKALYVLLYSAVFFPFLRKILQIYFVDKLIIPQFILDHFSKNPLIALLIILSLLLFFWLAARLLHSLPLLYQEGKTVRQAVVISLQKTQEKGVWKSYFRLLWLVTQTLLVFLGVGLALYGLQVLADTLPDQLAFGLAVLHMIILYLAYYGIIFLFLLRFISLAAEAQLPPSNPKKSHHKMRLGILGLLVCYFGFQAFISFYSPFQDLPVTISHRGVDQENGVQNTIDSLKKTAKLKPDYIEMDVQETKDGLFVVMHDTDLKVLTGQEGGTHDYTLAELTQMRVSENGQSSLIPSFEDYLLAAERLEQKLLVEIKTTSADSPLMMENFLSLYGRRLLEGGHQMQSLDYGVIQAVKDFEPKLLSAFILPFNSIYPHTVADGYTMEYTSLDQTFVIKSWLRKKFVYAWTPNDEEGMMRALQLQVDGIITDNLELLQETMRYFTQYQSYADLLFLQVYLLSIQF